MSSIAQMIPSEVPARPQPAAATLRWLGRNGFALGDQALISGTNFATGILTARALHPDEFGTFSIIYVGLLLGNILQSTLVTQAHNVLGATRSGRDYRRYTTSAAVGQIALIAIE